MDPIWSNLSSGTLPGAWSSTWTLSEGASNWMEQPHETSNFPKRFRSNESLQDEGNANIALRDMSSSKWCIVSHSADPNIYSEDSGFHLSDEDSESGLSDDFYSFISQEDPEPDVTLSPSVAIPCKPTNGAENILEAVAATEPDLDLTSLNSNLHFPTQQDLSDDDHPKVPVPLSPHPSETSFVSTHSSSSSSVQPVSSSPDVNAIINPHCAHSERASVHSNFSAFDYPDFCNLADRLDSRLTPQISSDFNNLFFSQPDGNNPWTLSLEPTPSFTESVASTTSFSVESSSASDGVYPSEVYQQPPALVPIEPYSPSLDQPPSIATSGGVDSFYRGPSIEVSPLEQRPTGPQTSNLTIGHRNESIRSRNVIQKTKEFCSKFKRFITSKSSKSKNETNLLSPPDAYTLVDVDAQPHGYPFPRSASRMSSQRPGSVMRSAKISSPSVFLSESPSYYRGESAVDNIHDDEYHARPKTLQEIRSRRRRFSLPAVSSASTHAGTSARANVDLFASQRKARRMG